MKQELVLLLGQSSQEWRVAEGFPNGRALQKVGSGPGQLNGSGLSAQRPKQPDSVPPRRVEQGPSGSRAAWVIELLDRHCVAALQARCGRLGRLGDGLPYA